MPILNRTRFIGQFVCYHICKKNGTIHPALLLQIHIFYLSIHRQKPDCSIMPQSILFVKLRLINIIYELDKEDGLC